MSTFPARRHLRPMLMLGLLAALAGGAPAQAPAGAAPAPTVAAGRSPAASAAPRAQRTSRPAWSELNAAQQAALAPLASTWPSISEAQKRKWIALAQNFGAMPSAERATLHARMAEWVALTPQQRVQARLNFGEIRQLPEADKKAKWEAYQKLSPEERRRLAASAARRPPSTAAAVRPVPAQKLATIRRAAPDDLKPPRITLAPMEPQPPVPGAAPAAAEPAPTNAP